MLASKWVKDPVAMTLTATFVSNTPFEQLDLEIGFEDGAILANNPLYFGAVQNPAWTLSNNQDGSMFASLIEVLLRSSLIA